MLKLSRFTYGQARASDAKLQNLNQAVSSYVASPEIWSSPKLDNQIVTLERKGCTFQLQYMPLQATAARVVPLNSSSLGQIKLDGIHCGVIVE